MARPSRKRKRGKRTVAVKFVLTQCFLPQPTCLEQGPPLLECWRATAACDDARRPSATRQPGHRGPPTPRGQEARTGLAPRGSAAGRAASALAPARPARKSLAAPVQRLSGSHRREEEEDWRPQCHIQNEYPTKEGWEKESWKCSAMGAAKVSE
ncbi:unnamed protein product [Prorocentrum cordatum]|uniref:Uncharacterized protein n=1 Tax=Prorocentrum cordatum TaxID=2364126 RepID=A0ABN9S4U2_9DINO|nr:unnamed protein product [Polarella glacialis]